MIVVAQRCSGASVSIDGAVVSKINLGLLLLVGIEKGDGQSDIQKVVNKISNLRIFEDENNKMNLSVMDVSGSLLVVSQFTLCGSVKKGRRPSFVNAEITGASAENIVVLPRNLVRLDGTVITVTDEREILIKDVEVQRADDEKIYISAGLQAGDNIAVSAVPNAYDGMKVRLPGDEPPKTMTSTKEESE